MQIENQKIMKIGEKELIDILRLELDVAVDDQVKLTFVDAFGDQCQQIDEVWVTVSNILEGVTI